MKYQRTTLSLQFRHPERDLTAICDELGLAPKFIWKAGDQRRTPRGNLLEGIRPSSYCSIDLGPTRRVSLARQIETALGLLQPHRRMLRRFSSSGGGISLFIGWFLDADIREVLEHRLLGQAADLRVAIDLDVYIPERLKKSR